jgi:phage shock protein PspC (stress-responsive transcriptional regulator)
MRIRPNRVEVLACGVFGVLAGIAQNANLHVNLVDNPAYFVGGLIGTFIGVLVIWLAIKAVIVCLLKFYRFIRLRKN